MSGFPSPFGGSDDDNGLFDEYDEFIADNNPSPGAFIADHDILEAKRHIEFHNTTKEIFEIRGVYDMTFGYNLARLNLDSRHPNAGYRYAEEVDDPSVLRAEFTPTTPFCPQSDTLTKGSFRAWNDLDDKHEYDMVRVRLATMHHRSEDINTVLEELEENYLETGAVSAVSESGRDDLGYSEKSECSDGTETTNRGYGPDAPF